MNQDPREPVAGPILEELKAKEAQEAEETSEFVPNEFQKRAAAFAKLSAELAVGGDISDGAFEEALDAMERAARLPVMQARYSQSEDDNLDKAKNLVRQVVTEGRRWRKVPEFFVLITWFNYNRGNWKALAITTLPDNTYYELTYNRDKHETYIDTYEKTDNRVVTDFDPNYTTNIEGDQS